MDTSSRLSNFTRVFFSLPTCCLSDSRSSSQSMLFHYLIFLILYRTLFFASTSSPSLLFFGMELRLHSKLFSFFFFLVRIPSRDAFIWNPLMLEKEWVKNLWYWKFRGQILLDVMITLRISVSSSLPPCPKYLNPPSPSEHVLLPLELLPSFRKLPRRSRKRLELGTLLSLNSIMIWLTRTSIWGYDQRWDSLSLGIQDLGWEQLCSFAALPNRSGRTRYCDLCFKRGSTFPNATEFCTDIDQFFLQAYLQFNPTNRNYSLCGNLPVQF